MSTYISPIHNSLRSSFDNDHVSMPRRSNHTKERTRDDLIDSVTYVEEES
jgi:hypothetical protein